MTNKSTACSYLRFGGAVQMDMWARLEACSFSPLVIQSEEARLYRSYVRP